MLTDDEHHDRAIALQQSLRSPFLTTDYVLLEFADALCGSPPLRRIAHATIDLLRADSSVRIVPATPALFDTGLALYRSRPDQRWSLTDCISFEVMRSDHCAESLTSDHHFEQAGFSALLRRAPT